ncbi:hypothetical protein [Phaeobacter sp. NW0010-22]|uniref:hypothetical protein n=1 Tax=Phaeobacter sp. NW0010-22 TaxID=3135907 RepID=UPI0031075FD9
MRWIILLSLLGSAVSAQDLQGNDTPGNWRVTHHQIFGIWNSMCDEREEHGALKQRCYLRRVDVFSQAPKFAAQFIFITPEPSGYKIDFGMEFGTLFHPGGFRIETMQGDIWRTRLPGCLTGLSCTFTGKDAQILIDSMGDGEAFRFTFRDSHGQSQDLSWPLQTFDSAWVDFQTQAKSRGLIQE